MAYELIKKADKEITVITNIYSNDLAYMVALGRENDVKVRVCDSFIFDDEFATRVLLYIPISCSGKVEDVEWFLEKTEDLRASMFAA